MMDSGGGGFIPERVVTPILTHAMTRRVGGREKERKTDKQRAMRKEKRDKRKTTTQKKTKKTWVDLF